ncbi:MAG: 5'-methylthioadenosine/adenosylhomocysteine nucleosidase [Lachnospiraceae bacterium]|nr:5'-methylthioadenosine/adenosylhomocysteine nucleosidase [Lachnospiraceae bacterium]
MKKIGIIGAMELEIEELKNSMIITKTETYAKMTFYEGTMGDVPVVLVRSGIGKVNAAICAQILADIYKVTHLINTGVAGSLNSKLDIGDILVSTEVTYHDVDVTIFGYAPGEVPQLGVKTFPADEKMSELAVTICNEVNPDIKCFKGLVVSGDQFISGKEKKEAILSLFNADCAEMEGASIGHTSFLNNIPFVIIRAISDKADDSASVDYPTFEKAAAAHSAKLTLKLVSSL